MGDFNAKVGQHADLWKGCIGRFGLPGSVCDNGQTLMEFCACNEKATADVTVLYVPHRTSIRYIISPLKPR